MNNEPLPGYDVWASVDRYPREDWCYEVQNGDTNLGYWDWVRHRMAADNDEIPDPNEHD